MKLKHLFPLPTKIKLKEDIGRHAVVDPKELERVCTDFGPTPVFRKIYGNYCGPGNCGGPPIDDIDAACKAHDMCYHYNGRNNKECDLYFVATLTELLKRKNLTFKQRTAATIMKSYFDRWSIPIHNRHNSRDMAKI